jgi:hypothetical protein
MIFRPEPDDVEKFSIFHVCLGESCFEYILDADKHLRNNGDLRYITKLFYDPRKGGEASGGQAGHSFLISSFFGFYLWI